MSPSEFCEIDKTGSSVVVKRKSVRAFLSALSEEELYYVANPGNAGDAAIALGTYQLFDRLGMSPRAIAPEQPLHVEGKTILFAGGGNLVEGKYCDMHDALLKYLEWGNRCILLPHTVFGYADVVKHAKSGNLTIFCREESSYRLCAESNDFDTTNLFLDDDLALQMDPAFLRPFAERKGTGVAYCFRTDAESTHLLPIPVGNRDVSLSWNGSLWHDREMTRAVVEALLTYLSRFEEVRTDRLHVAILSTLLGRKVVLYPNSYYKNQAVYEMSLAKFGNVTFIREFPSGGHYESATRLLERRRSKLPLGRVIKFAILGKLAITHRKRQHYREKLQKLFA